MKTVAIIGAGTAGLATSIFLSKLNYKCDLYEEFEQPQAIGAGLLLQPQGMQVLNQLNLLENIYNNSSRIESLYGLNMKGKEIMDFQYESLQKGLFGLGIHRGQLFSTLYQRATKSLNHTFLGQKVISIKQTVNSAQLTIEKGLSKSYDMIVVANGTWSNLTKDLNIRIKHKPYPWGALWNIFDDPHLSFKGCLNQRYNKTHTMAGFLPSGINPQNQKNCVSFFWSLEANKFKQWKSQDIQKWKSKVLQLWPETHPFIDQISSHEDLKFVRYADTVMNQWHDNRIVVIGDAAHAMSPQLGQGANMALVDAQQLYESLKQHKQTIPALKEYSKQRKKHLRYYQYASHLLTPFFQSNSHTAAVFRDLFFPPMKHIGIAKKHALTTLFGVKTSLFHNKPTIDLVKLSAELDLF